CGAPLVTTYKWLLMMQRSELNEFFYSSEE
ncbi:hypothetical protein AVEN_130572-1, partial [Araneus ventricosus]